jgi:hypothetical protein
MKKILLTLREYQNKQGETKKARVQVGKVHQYPEGGESIILDAALCASLAAMGQKALHEGKDSVWLSIFEEQPQGQQMPQQQYQQQAPQQQQQSPQPTPVMPPMNQGQNNPPF